MRTTTSTSSSSTLPSPVIPTLKDVPYRIHQLVDRSKISCVRFRYLTVATEQVALECRALLSSGQIEFADLARSISLDELTKENGGLAGWVDVNVANDTNGSAPALLYPKEIINKALFMNKGDISVVSGGEASSFHVVQLVDLQARLSPQVTRRRREAYLEMNNLLLHRDSSTDAPAPPLTYFIDTMGCQMNVADSERMEGQLAELGFTRSTQTYAAHLQPSNSDETRPAVVILNTCSIRDHAEQKVYSYLGPHALRKRRGENVCIIVAGCVAQQEGERILRRFPEVDIVMGPQYAPHLTDLLLRVAEGHQVVATDPLLQTETTASAGGDGSHVAAAPLRKSGVHAYVNIIYGCNERCTYCVVPQTRGVEQSRTMEAVLGEVRDLQAQGYGEVTLLGQNVDSWGRDFYPKQRFADLLEAVGRCGVRVRFLTSHPKYMSERVVQAVAANPLLMPCFNVPFQAGSDRVLQNMRRVRWLFCLQRLAFPDPPPHLCLSC